MKLKKIERKSKSLAELLDRQNSRGWRQSYNSNLEPANINLEENSFIVGFIGNPRKVSLLAREAELLDKKVIFLSDAPGPNTEVGYIKSIEYIKIDRVRRIKVTIGGYQMTEADRDVLYYPYMRRRAGETREDFVWVDPQNLHTIPIPEPINVRLDPMPEPIAFNINIERDVEE